MKKIILTLGIIALLATPTLAKDFYTPVNQFVAPTADFTDNITQYDVTMPMDNVVLGDPIKLFDDGIVKQDERVPRINNNRSDGLRGQAYDITDPNSVYNNSLAEEAISRNVTAITPTYKSGKKHGGRGDGRGGGTDRQIRGFTYGGVR